MMRRDSWIGISKIRSIGFLYYLLKKEKQGHIQNEYGPTEKVKLQQALLLYREELQTAPLI